MLLKTGPNAIWLKRVLIPFWVLQTLFLIAEIAGAVVIIMYVDRISNRGTHKLSDGTVMDVQGNGSKTYISPNGTRTTISSIGEVVKAVAGVYLAVVAITIIFTLFEIIMYMTKNLSASLYFGFQLTKFILWSVVFVVSVLVRKNSIDTTVLYLVSTIIEELLFLGSLIYASVIYHRYRMSKRGGAYAPGVMPSGQFANYGDVETAHRAPQSAPEMQTQQ